MSFGGHSVHFLKMACMSNIAHRTAKRSEIWNLWILVTLIWGIFNLAGFKVIWGHLVHYSQKKLVIQQQLVLLRNE